jgi:hypothetical protein
MTTTAQNPVSIIEHDLYPQSVVCVSECEGSKNIVNEGDLVFWDGANYTVRSLLEIADVESGKGNHHSKGFMGVALGSNYVEVFGNEEPRPEIAVGARMCIYVYGTAGDHYKPFDFVTFHTDAQHVTNSGATEANAVGVVIIDPPATARGQEATPVPEEIEGVGTETRLRIQLLPKHIVGAKI